MNEVEVNDEFSESESEGEEHGFDSPVGLERDILNLFSLSPMQSPTSFIEYFLIVFSLS